MLPASLRGSDGPDTFPFKTLRDRLPVILTKCVDTTVRQRPDLKTAIQELGRLRYELQTDKPFTLLDDGMEDAQTWNHQIHSYIQLKQSWFSAPWLFSECYMYRRIIGIFDGTDYDWFAEQKQQSFTYDKLLTYYRKFKDLKLDQYETFRHLMLSSLWGNQADLSLGAGLSKEDREASYHQDAHSVLDYLLTDDTRKVYEHLSKVRKVNIVLDNAGVELFHDLMLANYLTSIGLQVILYVKKHPWFVSDTTYKDYVWMLERLKQTEMSELALLDVSVVEHPFWTTFQTFAEYPQDIVDHDTLTIFKGDLNYRKLLGDCHWSYETPFADVAPKFPLVALRTNKSNLIVGVTEPPSEPDWLISGKFGVIQSNLK